MRRLTTYTPAPPLTRDDLTRRIAGLRAQLQTANLQHRLGVYGAHSVTVVLPPGANAEQLAEDVVQGLHRVAERVSA